MKGTRGVGNGLFTNVDREFSMVSEVNIIAYSLFIPQVSPNGATVIHNGTPIPMVPGQALTFASNNLNGCPVCYQDIVEVKFDAADMNNKFYLLLTRVPKIVEVD